MSLADEPASIAEVYRMLSDFRAEMRAQLAQLVRADVYRAEQNAVEQRITAVERDLYQEREDRRTLKRLTVGAFLSAAATFIFALLTRTINGGA